MAPSPAERTRVAEALFAEVRETGEVPLGVLTDEEEAALGGGRWALGDARTWRESTARSPEGRERVAGVVRRSLVESEQVRPHATGETVDLAPRLGVIATARTRADFLVVARLDREGGGTEALPLGYAVADDRWGYRGLVVERRSPGFHEYSLCSTSRAAEIFVDWAQRVVSSPSGGDQVAVLEVMRFDQGAPVAGGISLSRTGQAAALMLDGSRPRTAGDRTSLVATLATLVDQAVARGRGAVR